MDQVTRVHQFDALEHLIGNHQYSFEGEAAPALVELIFQGRSEKIHDHQVIRILGTEIVYLGKAGSILQFSVNLVFVSQLRTSGTMLFELDGNLFAIGTDTEVNVTKGSSTDALGDAVFLLVLFVDLNCRERNRI